jgi:hypothetical protein
MSMGTGMLFQDLKALEEVNWGHGGGSALFLWKNGQFGGVWKLLKVLNVFLLIVFTS